MPEPTHPALAPLVALLNEPGVQHLQPPNWRSRVDAAIAEASALLGEARDECPHNDVRTFRTHPPHSKCLDCYHRVERVWQRVPPSDAQEGAQVPPRDEAGPSVAEDPQGSQVEGEGVR